jgi:DNA mismatch repair ATPase MutS
MTAENLRAFYQERVILFSSKLTKVSKSINWISNVRLLAALLFIAALWFGFTYHLLLYALPVIVIFFVVLVRNHGKLYEEKEHLQNLVKLNQHELQSLQGDTSSFQDGSEFINAHHPYSHDLDIFGNGSLFQFTNRSNTITGKKKFAQRLTTPLLSPAGIESNQLAIRELSTQSDFRQHFQAAGLEINEQPEDRSELLQWVKQPSFIFGRAFYRVILIAVPVITLALVAAAFISVSFRPFAILMATVQWAFTGYHMKKINLFHEYISRKKNILKKYARLLRHLQEQKFSSTLLTKLHEGARDAHTKVDKLASLVHSFDARLNSMTMLFVNSVLLYDLNCVYRLEKWKEENAAQLDGWIEAVSEAEVLCSFGTFAFNNAGFNFPRIHANLSVTATVMGHPLIPQSECVPNDFRIGSNQKVLIVTGANMAGKSTFLRTVGVNLVLALAGAPVCASEFACPIINLRTGMRTADSLKDHQSYFYAELNRLQGIMEELRKDIPLMILLDEILKGTNSTDKQTGSIALVRQLLPHPCLAIIATHDLALGDLETEFPNDIKNYCFEAEIRQDQLSFDYKLKPGLAQKMNATFLMKKMGIIPS